MVGDTYQCVVEFEIEGYDDDGFSTEESMTVYEGSLFVEVEPDKKIIDGEIRLEGIEDAEGQWLEITEDTLENNFIKVDEV